MPSYRLTKDAENDLRGIWRYTRKTWSENQADRYLDELEVVCEQIASGEIRIKSLSDIHPDLCFHHHNRHYVFWLAQPDQPIVIAFLHDSMDFVRHLRKRLLNDPH